MSLCKHLRSRGRKPMREPGNRGITGQQPLGINRSFHYLVLKGPKSALKYCIQEHLELISVFFVPLLVRETIRWFSVKLTQTCMKWSVSSGMFQDMSSFLSTEFNFVPAWRIIQELISKWFLQTLVVEIIPLAQRKCVIISLSPMAYPTCNQ